MAQRDGGGKMTKRRLLIVLGGTIAVTALHWVTPAGPHSWHWAHLAAQRLYYVPLLLAAAWFSWRGGILTALAVSALYLTHILRDWRGFPMVQAEQLASVGSFWLITILASWFFGRLRAFLEETQSAHQDTLTALASSLELRERYTAGHSERVRAYTMLLAERMNVRDPEVLKQWAEGALFHDIGKIGIEDAILLKAGSLDPGQREVMRRHCEFGAALVGRVRSLAGTRELILSHHERFDGSGYPRGLRGASIPLGARLFAVADTLDAMTTNRSYQRARTFRQAEKAIVEGRGTLYDPGVVDAFLSIPFETWRDTALRHGVALRRDDSGSSEGGS